MPLNPLTSSDEKTYDNLLDEIIAKARLKGANISSWSQSPNGRTIVNIPGKLPIYYLSMDAAADSLIHQYKLASEYRYLYQNAAYKFKPLSQDSTLQDEQKSSITAQAIYECDPLIQNMSNELTGSIKRKLNHIIEKINSTHHLNPSEFYLFQTSLAEHYRNKMIEAPTTQKKKQLQMFTHFIEEISHSEM